MNKQADFLEMENFIRNNYKFAHNLVLNKIARIDPSTRDIIGYLDNRAINSLWSQLQRNGAEVPKSTLMSYLYSDSHVQFDPFVQYFKQLSSWTPEQPDYIGLLIDTITVPEVQKELWAQYLKRWLIAAAGCATDPNVTNQQVLVLVGSQGIGKTKWTEKLVPADLKDYYHSGDVNPGNKDSSINLSECFLINLDELGNLNKGDLNSLKQLITQSSIRIRRPYAELPEKMPRRASLIGSVNNAEFLRDDTGNRRYLCVDTLSIDYNHCIDIDRVYAQAYYLFNQGEKHWFCGEEVTAINTQNKQYQVVHPELEYVNQYFEPCARDDKDAEEMTVTQIQMYLRKNGAHILNVSNVRLGVALKASDYIKIRKNGGTNYYKLKKRQKSIH